MRRKSSNVTRFLKAVGWAAATGAISAITTDGVTPIFEGKGKAVAIIGAAGAIGSVVTLLQENPFSANGKSSLPSPQKPPSK